MRHLSTLCLFLALTLSGTAEARQQFSGFYAGLMAGASMINADIGQRAPTFIEDTERSPDDTGAMVSVAFGFKAKNLRVALEGSTNTKANLGQYKYTKHDYSLQLYYDLPTRMRLKPFLNAGVGEYRAKVKTDPGIERKISNTFFDVGGGFTLALTQRTSIDLGYRYVDLGDEKFTDSEPDHKVSFKAYQHLIYMGCRYVF